MERQVVLLQKQLVYRGIAVTTAVPEEGDGAAYADWSLQEGAPAQTTRALHLPLSARQGISDIFTLARFIRDQRPTKVNFHFAGGWIALREIVAVRLAGHRPICSIHSADAWENMGEHRRRMTRLGGTLSAAVIANSQATRDQLIAAQVPADRLHTIHCGVPSSDRPPHKESARLTFSLDPCAFLVAVACRLVAEKGIADLISALAHVPAIPGRPLVLLIAGEGPERDALEKQAAAMLPSQGHTYRFLGRLPSTDTLFAASDLCGLPSHNEAFGLVYLEAAIQGCPSVGFAVGGVPEVVLSGKTGILVAPQDQSALTGALNRLYQSPEECVGMGNAAKQYVRRFSDISLADAYANLFQF
jgi:glycosyltransferase involved in cell wall biosynthesis